MPKSFFDPKEIIPCEECGDFEDEQNMQDNVCWCCADKPEE